MIGRAYLAHASGRAPPGPPGRAAQRPACRRSHVSGCPDSADIARHVQPAATMSFLDEITPAGRGA
jgi:hypothetical protein